MAFYVDSIQPDENRNHAMGYPVGCLAIGYSIGNFLAGYIADLFSYETAFRVAAFLSLICVAIISSFEVPATQQTRKRDLAIKLEFGDSLKAVWEPNMAGVVIVALFLNLLHQVGNVFLPL
jgi:predicted MFS family arabinose efflux permease